MAVAVSSEAAPKVQSVGTYDRVFYSGIAIFMAFVVFVGFAPTFYLRPVFGAPATVSGATTLSPLAYAHGAIFTAWVLLFIVQTAFIANRRVKLHRRLGVAGGVLAAAMVVVGTRTAIAAAARGGAPPGVDPLAFLAIPIFDMVVFPIFVIAALVQRRNKEAHKRLMLLAYVSILTAAVARWPGVLPYGPLMFFGLTLIVLIVAVVYDVASRRRVHPVYIWGGALLVASVPVRLMVSSTSAWRSIAEFLTQ
jgi:hypothetical protein